MMQILSQDGSTRSFLDDWVFEEGEYVSVSVVNLPFLGSNSMLSPKSRTDDGVLHLIIIRSGISKKNLLQVPEGPFCFSTGSKLNQACQIFLGSNLPKRENIPNNNKLYQMAIKYTKWQ
jgi:hypothetical protein